MTDIVLFSLLAIFLNWFFLVVVERFNLSIVGKNVKFHFNSFKCPQSCVSELFFFKQTNMMTEKFAQFIVEWSCNCYFWKDDSENVHIWWLFFNASESVCMDSADQWSAISLTLNKDDCFSVHSTTFVK